jgi:hypothetical protein
MLVRDGGSLDKRIVFGVLEGFETKWYCW